MGGKKFYPSYYKIGLEALERINQTFQVDFPEDEAVAIALHFVNLQETKAKFDEQLADMETLRDMLNIIKYHFTITLDENSMNYMRLVTHLQYFIERLRNNQTYSDNESQLYKQVKAMYPEAFAAVEKIEIYVKGKFNSYLTQEEYTT